tara:strand:- start:371 stop:742 length:372 start_codon:yes stop_codon:yes gene_type:complete
MSNSSQVDEISSIAGEPANDSPLKSVPPLDGRKVNDQVEGNDLKPRSKKAMMIIQTISIIIALILSAYSFTIIESLDSSSNAGADGTLIGNEELVIFVADNGLTGMELHLWSPLTLQDEWLIW